MQPEAVTFLIEALHDPDLQVRSTAVQGLVRLGSLRAVPPLRQLQNDKDLGSSIEQAVNSLFHKKLQAGKGYGWPAGSESLQQLCAVAKTLKGEQYGEKELQVLLSQLKSENFMCRSSSLYALNDL